MSSRAALPEGRRIVLEALVILVCGVLLGLSVNYRLVLDSLAGEVRLRPAPPPTVAYPEPVELMELRALLAAGALAVDARALDIYREGHLPGALSIPLGELEAALPALRARAGLERELVTYCSGDGCPDSFDLAVELLERGYTRVRVFEAGFPAWVAAGLPVESGP